jgi:hypothetical protein
VDGGQSGIVIDASELASAVKELEARLPGGAKSALTQIAEIMVGLVEDEYQTEGHGEWPPLAESTLRQRRKSASPKILQNTGVAVASTDSEVIGEGTDAAAVAFTNVPYMIYHTSSAPRHVIPYRNPFDFQFEELLEQSRELLLAAVAQWG